MRIFHMVGGLLVAVSAVFSVPAMAEAMLFGSADKGAQWHAEKCDGCHAARFADNGNAIYTREDRRVQTIEGLMKQVQFCSANSGAGLSAEQMDDITAYLNKHFYQFDDQ